MKKQILILSFFVLALIAGTTNSFGQNAAPGSAPMPLTCTDGPLNPMAGKSYDYQAEFAPVGGDAYWYGTKSTTFMTAGARVATELASGGADIAASTNYMTSATVATNPSTAAITWTSSALAGVDGSNPLFVVVEYEDAAACTNNMKVYQIEPINAFTVDIMNYTQAATPAPTAYGTEVDQCYDGVASAAWAAGSMTYDYGTNVLYYEVVAANFTGTFTPTFRLGGLQGAQTADIEWGVVNGTYDQTVTAGSGNGDYAAASISTTETATASGVSIYVRVTVDNLTYEGLTTDGITLAVDAVNSEGQADVDNSDCGVTTAFSDVATQNLTLRPTVTPVAPATFE